MSSNTTDQLLRLPQVLALIPVSRSALYAGIKLGIYPAQVKVGSRSVAWRRSDVEKAMSRFNGELPKKLSDSEESA